MKNIVLDVWGGHHSMDHVARFVLPLSDALLIATEELAQGYLVNLRQEAAWGSEQNFDIRKGKTN